MTGQDYTPLNYDIEKIQRSRESAGVNRVDWSEWNLMFSLKVEDKIYDAAGDSKIKSYRHFKMKRSIQTVVSDQSLQPGSVMEWGCIGALGKAHFHFCDGNIMQNSSLRLHHISSRDVHAISNKTM